MGGHAAEGLRQEQPLEAGNPTPGTGIDKEYHLDPIRHAGQREGKSISNRKALTISERGDFPLLPPQPSPVTEVSLASTFLELNCPILSKIPSHLRSGGEKQ